MMDDGKPSAGNMDDDSWMDEMGWGDDATPEPEPVAAAAPAPAPAPVMAAAAPVMAQAAPAAAAATFAPLPGTGLPENVSQIDLLLDISLQVTVELGRARMKIQEILGLRNGSVIELDRLAGEPADILVNGTLIAKGEVVVVDEKFGVRVIEVVSRAKRIASLG
ncbi:MAG: flagellar motor switch protein FliN [Chloroflexota bacterium]